jgi:hypothetical protein
MPIYSLFHPVTFDFEGVYFLQADERYQEERNKAYISKWLRKPIRQYDSFEISIEGLKSFFKDVKVSYMLPLLVLNYSIFFSFHD